MESKECSCVLVFEREGYFVRNTIENNSKYIMYVCVFVCMYGVGLNHIALHGKEAGVSF